MRILGLDIGDRFIGVALSDESGIIASGLETIKRTRIEEDSRKLKELIDKHEVKEIVYGIPKNLYGGIGEQGEKTLKFIEHLKKSIDIQMNPWDERFTSKEAERVLIEKGIRREKRKQMRDRLSAVLILQGYLDSKKTYNL
ncbi:MAG: Holliday junction DNA helicase RuvA [Candidatus Schekmanbacteria bacterium RIFCSPHIGHO2_02_FULL_38_11]|uniref:Putative pre-16S rRNA nuclease n=1 Tax=Candidatus Schekmanbacteria bacterium RIFCSPLOWO2_12_FULL_38_15 TaxID=1817883 RepID=A0A1F7SJG9_9BACT|nr:MAG: Holliday junction DNA helicase RuvA [Candidatus Schekmanbacteria bacterium GWA2_38_9]OGL48075.1 MAG: Holliday junction DNA helicase RuvA [Candidatus Schekmanbacteria bacterium RIFCSPHIGHO2_02_FULL_38_11]OGL50446.1 MAG: Holliday junction DNA helicase RuvA [Candidatus Schekmanbacteria bacterium RIFCSPLOWO2_02_FULL_38_14]OGL53905.1 MAG: Holliday junction DNA helicase RuvA [Candidatus Schekmanbacteria bacterium RIFCSPLOWO2_12_FULL_38_15]